MRKLKIDLPELVSAFEESSPELNFYLDLETGEVVLVTEETRGEIERVYAIMYGGGEEPLMSFDTALEQSGAADWEQEALHTADLVEKGFGERFIEIPSDESRDGYRDMAAFIDTVQNRRLQDHLERAIQGKGAFRRFKDTLLDDPTERERWFAFQNERLHQRVLEWLAGEEIEPILE